MSFSISVIPNCQFRSKTSRLKTFTANQLDEIKDPSGLFYILPFQKVSRPPPKLQLLINLRLILAGKLTAASSKSEGAPINCFHWNKQKHTEDRGLFEFDQKQFCLILFQIKSVSVNSWAQMLPVPSECCCVFLLLNLQWVLPVGKLQ